MKKKLFVALLSVATVMALAIPSMAFAVGSNEGTDVGGGTVSGVTINGRATGLSDPNAKLIVTETSDSTIEAQIGTLSSTQTKFGPYEVKMDATFTELTITFTVGTQYNGMSATIYHNHNGSVTKSSTTVQNGKVSVTVNQLSSFAIVVDSSSSSNASSTSPKTGADTGLVALMAGTALIAAAGVALVARKRTQD